MSEHAKLATIQILGLADGTPTPYDGQYVLEYDPERDGTDPHGNPMSAHLLTTPDRDKALLLSTKDAFELWRKVPQRAPTRIDGKPNRPLTAFTVTIESPQERLTASPRKDSP